MTTIQTAARGPSIGQDTSQAVVAIAWECTTCRSFMRAPPPTPEGYELVMPNCDHGFPGYEILPMFTARPLPGETLAEYHQRVYGKPYPHEDRWPGATLASSRRGGA